MCATINALQWKYVLFDLSGQWTFELMIEIDFPINILLVVHCACACMDMCVMCVCIYKRACVSTVCMFLIGSMPSFGKVSINWNAPPSAATHVGPGRRSGRRE